MDPNLKLKKTPKLGDGTTYKLGSGLMMHREKRTLKEIRRQMKRRIHQKRQKKQKKNDYIRISLPLKEVGDNCDEVIFDMEEFELILRSVRYVR